MTDYKDLVTRLRETTSRSKRNLLDEAADVIEAMAEDITECAEHEIDGACRICGNNDANNGCDYECGKCTDKCKCYLCNNGNHFEWRGVQK